MSSIPQLMGEAVYHIFGKTTGQCLSVCTWKLRCVLAGTLCPSVVHISDWSYNLFRSLLSYSSVVEMFG